MIACKNVTHTYFHKQTVADPSEMLFSICWLFRDITYKSLTVFIVCTEHEELRRRLFLCQVKPVGSIGTFLFSSNSLTINLSRLYIIFRSILIG